MTKTKCFPPQTILVCQVLMYSTEHHQGAVVSFYALMYLYDSNKLKFFVRKETVNDRKE